MLRAERKRNNNNKNRNSVIVIWYPILYHKTYATKLYPEARFEIFTAVKIEVEDLLGCDAV
jgi:hypothetical protein